MPWLRRWLRFADSLQILTAFDGSYVVLNGCFFSWVLSKYWKWPDQSGRTAGTYVYFTRSHNHFWRVNASEGLFYEGLLGPRWMLCSAGGATVWERCLAIADGARKEKTLSGNLLWLLRFLEGLRGFSGFVWGLITVNWVKNDPWAVPAPANSSSVMGQLFFFFFWQILVLSLSATAVLSTSGDRRSSGILSGCPQQMKNMGEKKNHLNTTKDFSFVSVTTQPDCECYS